MINLPFMEMIMKLKMVRVFAIIFTWLISANAHVIAIKRLLENINLNNYEVFNIGTGKGSSVLECVQTFEAVNQVKVKYEIGNAGWRYCKGMGRYKKANEILGWEAKST